MLDEGRLVTTGAADFGRAVIETWPESYGDLVSRLGVRVYGLGFRVRGRRK